jgi:phage baseplate assembly protein W
VSSFNFKSTGKKRDNRKFTHIPESFTQLKPIGIKTPLEIKSNSEDLFVSNTSTEDQLKDNLKNFILTNNGERLGRYNFGANLSRFVFEASAIPNYKSSLEGQLRSSISKNFSAITIASIDIAVSLTEKIGETFNVLEQNVYHSKKYFKPINSQKINNSNTAKVTIIIKFAIPSLSLTDQALEVKLFVGG